MDKWIKCLAQGGNLHATAIIATDLVEDARKRHQLKPAETKALGEALMASLLLSSTTKSGERTSLSVKGEKKLRQAVVDSNADGTVRGFILSRAFDGEIDETQGPWQGGILSVTRLKLDQKEPYVGTVPNVTGHLAKDITFYLTQSEQIPSAVGLAVNIDPMDGRVISAGAFLVQVMPGASKAEILMVENNIIQMEELASQISHESNPTLLLGNIFSDLTFTLLEDRPLHFECNCSKDRVVRAIKLLGRAEIEDMIEKDDGAQVNCDFCSKSYKFSKEELSSL